MKYCPYCGASVLGDAVSFCAECGKALPEPNRSTKPKVKSQKKSRKQNKNVSSSPLSQKNPLADLEVSQEKAREAPQDDKNYDGYYDDIVPSDIDRQREGFDRELFKKIFAIAGGVIIIIGLSVAAMYLL